jgi:isopentenyl-diphosphate delta-isomerase
MKQQEVILVSPDDVPVGVMEKMEAHRKGLLHRACCVFFFYMNGCMLLQQRAAKKYHGGLLWTNACCSHPYPGEDVHVAAERRLNEELGFTTPLQKIFSFTYKANVENDLIEHEYDHVFAGEYEEQINLNENEVAACSYHSIEEIKGFLKQRPDDFTAWFKLAFPQLENWWEKAYKLNIPSNV